MGCIQFLPLLLLSWPQRKDSPVSPEVPADLIHPWVVELSAWISPTRKAWGACLRKQAGGTGSSAETETQRNTCGNSGHPEGPGAVTPRVGHMTTSSTWLRTGAQEDEEQVCSAPVCSVRAGRAH